MTSATMKRTHLNVNGYYFLLFLGLCSCTGCDIERTEIELSKSNRQLQVVDVTIGKCLVNTLQGDITEDSEVRFADLMLKHLREVFPDSVVYIKSATNMQYREPIPFEISDGLLKELRKTTTYTYLFNVRAIEWNSESSYSQMQVDIVVFDLDTGNAIYSQQVVASEYEPESSSNNTFVFDRSSDNLIKNALQSGLRDFKRGAKKFKSAKYSTGK